jgi:hypothetical protein
MFGVKEDPGLKSVASATRTPASRKARAGAYGRPRKKAVPNPHDLAVEGRERTGADDPEAARRRAAGRP